MPDLSTITPTAGREYTPYEQGILLLYWLAFKSPQANIHTAAALAGLLRMGDASVESIIDTITSDENFQKHFDHTATEETLNAFGFKKDGDGNWFRDLEKLKMATKKVQ